MPPRPSVSAKKGAKKPAPAAVDPLDQFLADHEAEIEQLDNGKIRVKISGVDLPKQFEALQKYFTGKSIKKAKKKAELAKINLDEEFKFIEQHKKLKNQYYCTLTKTHINADADEIRAHVKGKKYQHELKKYEAIKAAEEADAAAKKAKRDAKRALGESVDDDVFGRLPDAVADEEGEGDDDEDEEADDEDMESAESDEEEDDEDTNQLVREIAEEDDGMPIIRKRPATAADRKRAREESENVAELMDEDDDFEEVAGGSDDEEEDEESEEEIVQTKQAAKPSTKQSQQPKQPQQATKQQNGHQSNKTSQPETNGPPAKKRK